MKSKLKKEEESVASYVAWTAFYVVTYLLVTFILAYGYHDCQERFE